MSSAGSWVSPGGQSRAIFSSSRFAWLARSFRSRCGRNEWPDKQIDRPSQRREQPMTRETNDLPAVTVNVFPGGFNWGLYVGQDKGFFAREGIAVQIQGTPNSVTQMT